MASHSSILAWRIPWTEEPGGLQSIESQRVGHDWVTELNWILKPVRQEWRLWKTQQCIPSILLPYAEPGQWVFPFRILNSLSRKLRGTESQNIQRKCIQADVNNLLGPTFKAFPHWSTGLVSIDKIVWPEQINEGGVKSLLQWKELIYFIFQKKVNFYNEVLGVLKQKHRSLADTVL